MTVFILGRGRSLVDLVVAEARDHGIDTAGATTDAEALAALDSGEIRLLVIGGGVRDDSRERLKAKALPRGTTVVETPLRGRSPSDYIRQEIVPRLHDQGQG